MVVRCIDEGTGREQERNGFQSLIGVLGGATAHAARIVRNDAADRTHTRACRVRPKTVSIGLKSEIGPEHHRTRTHAQTLTVVFDATTGPVLTSVDQDAVS